MNLTSQTEMIPRTTLISSFWRRRLKKKKKPLQLCLQRQQGHPREKKRDRNTDSKEEEAREKGMTGIKFNLHSFTLAEEAKELVFPEETGSDGNTKRAKKRCKFVGESHSVTALLYVKIIFTQKTICLSRSHAHSLTFSFQHWYSVCHTSHPCTLPRCHFAPTLSFPLHGCRPWCSRHEKAALTAERSGATSRTLRPPPRRRTGCLFLHRRLRRYPRNLN